LSLSIKETMRSSKMEKASRLSTIDHSPAISLPNVGNPYGRSTRLPPCSLPSLIFPLLGGDVDFKGRSSLGKVGER